MRRRIELGFICCVLLALAAGCGGGGSTTGGAGGQMITRLNDGSFTADARILAAREATGPLISADLAGEIDADLARIRQQYPQVADLHIPQDLTKTDLLVAVPTSVLWKAAWENGALATGQAQLDSTLTSYGLSSVRPLFGQGLLGNEWFSLKFDRSLNMTALAPIVKASSSDIVTSEIDGFIGDGDRITFSQAGGRKTYVFSRGWGDCPAGCINRHSWTFTVSPLSGVSVQESGPALPANGVFGG